MQIFKTFRFMVGLLIIFVLFGYMIAGKQGVIIAFSIALATNFFSYFFSDKLVLKHYNAIAVNENNATGLYTIVRNLCQKSNLPLPRIYIIPEHIPNAFATGRNPQNASIAVTEGLLNLLSHDEIEGVIAHELSHVKHYDILIGSMVAVIAGAIAMLANFAQFGTITQSRENNRSNAIFMLIAVIVMPIVATIIQMAISREREYKADEGAAIMTGYPKHLANALRKLEGYAQNQSMQNSNKQSAHMFIINPLSGASKQFSSLFRTHPSTNDRIARLEAMRLNNS